MYLPKQLIIKGRKWSVKRVKNLTQDDGEKVNGLTDAEARTISVDKALEGESLEWVFWHEYSHALLYEAGVVGNTGGISVLAEEIICDNFADSMMSDKTVRFKKRRSKA